MGRNFFLLAVLLNVLPAQTIKAQSEKPLGSLFVIGGGDRSDSLMKQLVQTANLRAGDYIVVLPMASEQPEVGFSVVREQLKKQTGATVRNFDFTAPGKNSQPWIDSLSAARLIYILGGDQNRFMKSVLNTPIYQAIHKAFQQGATIAGTSAGAAVMSRYMITGKQLSDTTYKETFDKLWNDNIEFAEGLGLLPDVIIDQHFIKRSRYNRLLSALAAKPHLVCVGIDEGTALIVKGTQGLVAGDSQVLRFAHAKGRGVASNRLLKLQNIHLSISAAGDVINLRR